MASRFSFIINVLFNGKQDLPLAPDEYAGFVMTLLRILAFAPLAASGCDTQSQIEHTDLHSDHQKAEAEKKAFSAAEI